MTRTLVNRVLFHVRNGAIVRSSQVGLRCNIGQGSTVCHGAVINGSHLGRICYVNRYAAVYQSTIGDFCSIGPQAQIGPREHLTDEMTSCNELYTGVLVDRLAARNDSRTILGADVWVGAQALILRGTQVGVGAIIGGSALVTNDVPPYAVVVGSPARVVRLRFSENLVDELILSLIHI